MCAIRPGVAKNRMLSVHETAALRGMDDERDTERNCFYSYLRHIRNNAIEYRNTSLHTEQSEDGSGKSEEFERIKELTPEVLMPMSYTSAKSIFFFYCPSDDASLNRILKIVFEALRKSENSLKDDPFTGIDEEVKCPGITKICSIPIQQKLIGARS